MNWFAAEAASARTASVAIDYDFASAGRFPCSGLVEEAALDHALALLRRYLDVSRREQEDLVPDPLHASVEPVGEAAGEVDQALGQLLVGALQVEDHRHRPLEAVGDLLGVVEAARDHQMHLHRWHCPDDAVHP